MPVDFMKLFWQHHTLATGENFETSFWVAAEGAGLKRWRKGQPVAAKGLRLLIGLAAYSRDEIKLAQDIANIVALQPGMTIEFFSLQDIQNQADFDNYIPAMGDATPMRFVSTPVVGLWEDGVLIQVSQSGLALQMVRRLTCG